MPEFDSLVGNPLAKAALSKMLQQNAIPSTMLFVGPEGVGKSLFAKHFAYLALKTEKKNNHPDVLDLYPESKGGMHTMDTIREMIKDIELMPFESHLKFYIIHDADRMLPVHANALLKTLEEPKAHARVILLAKDKSALLDTILSRAIEVPFRLIEQKSLVQHLQEKHNLELSQAAAIAFCAQGSFGNLSLYLEEDQKSFIQDIIALLKYAFSDHFSAFFDKAKQIEAFITKQEEVVKRKLIDALFTHISFWFRDIHLLKSGCDIEQIFFKEEIESLQQIASHAQYALGFIEDKIAMAYEGLLRNIKLKYVLEELLLNVCQEMLV